MEEPGNEYVGILCIFHLTLLLSTLQKLSLLIKRKVTCKPGGVVKKTTVELSITERMRADVRGIGLALEARRVYECTSD